MESSPHRELSWWRVLLVGSRPGGVLSWWGIVLVGSLPSGELSWWRVVRVRVVQWGMFYCLNNTTDNLFFSYCFILKSHKKVSSPRQLLIIS